MPLSPSPRIRIAGPMAEHQLGHKAYRVEVVARIVFEMVAPSEADAERHARRLARAVVTNDEIAKIDVQAIDPIAQLREANLRGWLESEAVALMTEDQRERLGAGENMEAEILHVVRAELYKGFSMKRWEPIKWYEVQHPPTCKTLITSNPAKEAIDISTVGPEDSTGALWESPSPAEREVTVAIAQQIDAIENHPWLLRQSVRPVAFLVKHTAKCRACGSSIVRLSIRVVMRWAGHVLGREFAL